MATVLKRINWPERYALRAARMGASEIRELLKLLEQPDIISFAGGIPDPAMFPTAEFGEACASLLADPVTAPLALQYSVSEGYGPLRAWIATYMTAKGVACTADNVLITSGSQQGLDFLGKLLLSPGDTALVTAPTYLGALQAFNAYEPTYARLPGPGDNRDLAAIEAETIATGGRLSFAYVVPDFANPSGETMSLADRHGLLDLADQLDVVVVEDAAYTELRYDGDALPPLLALDAKRHGGIEHARTVYAGTFSKTLAPSLRVGWLCAAKPLIDKLVLAKQAGDLHSPTLNQMAMHQVAERVFESHVPRLRAAYRKRRDAMLAALDRCMPAGVSWTRPQGGMFVWVTLPDGMDGADLLARAVREAKVAFVPGGAFFADGSGRNTLRLSFSLADGEQIEAGIRRLAETIAG
ncbi:aminotransferase-like domain-containing protein [Marinivivus vitaminiproducens]|uniref:aminotransferase-like domain-containing protein n=1 Tax=Marinivivus vitaminiproducens TaxID=3035935 RepID=UPI0027A3F4CF|nr:PLP-dependent aminotransferase family protein [Geminicoccaceae bacterium SCSIO 64248]